MVGFEMYFRVELKGMIDVFDVLGGTKEILGLLMFGVINWVDGGTFH